MKRSSISPRGDALLALPQRYRAGIDLEVREGVDIVSIDMWGGYPLVVEKLFLNAEIVYDRFHVMQHVNRELNKLRRTGDRKRQ